MCKFNGYEASLYFTLGYLRGLLSAVMKVSIIILHFFWISFSQENVVEFHNNHNSQSVIRVPGVAALLHRTQD